MFGYLWDWIGSVFSSSEIKTSWNPPRDTIHLICDYLIFGEHNMGIKNLQKLRRVNMHWKLAVDNYFDIWMRKLDSGNFMGCLEHFRNRQKFRDIVVEGGKLIKVRLNDIRIDGSHPYLSQIYNTTYEGEGRSYIQLTYSRATIMIDISYCRAAFKKYKPLYSKTATVVIWINTDMNHPLLRRFNASNPNINNTIPLNGHKIVTQWRGNPSEHHDKIIKNICNGLVYDLTMKDISR